MNKLNFLSFLTILLLNISAVAQNASETAKIDALFVEYENQPGVAIGVLNQGDVVYQKTFGYANLDYDVKISDETVFDVGALAMHVTATCILQLEKEGKLSLNDPIQKHLPEWPNYEEGVIRIKNLLHHNSGLRDYLMAINFKGQSWNTEYDVEDALRFLRKQDVLGFTPGERYEYSNSNYVVLNHIVSTISQMTLNEFANKHIFEPLQMKHTFFYEGASQVIKNRAIAYNREDPDQGYSVQHYSNFSVTGDGRLCTTLKDFLKWTKNLEESKIVSANLFEKLGQRGEKNSGEAMTYALGLEYGVEYGFKFFGHNGYWGGFSSFLIRFPNPDLSVVVMTNNALIPAPRMAFQIAGFFLEDKEPKETKAYGQSKKDVQLEKSSLEKFTGDYFCEQTGYIRAFYVENDTLIYSISEGYTRKLVPVGPKEFRVVGAPLYAIQFEGSGSKKKMNFMREGFLQYQYDTYDKESPSAERLSALSGRYYSNELDVKYDLTVDGEQLVVSVNDEEFIRFLPMNQHIYTSQSGHHGFLRFSNVDGKQTFELNDYSMQKIKFVKMEDQKEQ